ncbi:MBL fold metallo-hydrolase [Pelotomaculum isophthalicicum JI]|uniref:MBL fold metallo-hydrolase n=2 Tax=Pelotomaculum TaxID=191373 RepID=A0A9X4JWN7_9FIRM|nr:MBL fold metallo-hydrolase [Pelotomaculum isophthalicicum]MDF9409792.1 MBL fold metallo-hydrolase [Pelotomaculum isophthalicicum JI]
MRITVLGCWGPYPRAGGACSGYLVSDGGVNVMLEAGSGALSRLMEHINFRSLDAVIVTHLHHDHYLDLFPLRHALEGARKDGSRDKPVKLFIPPRPGGEFSLLSSYNEAFKVKAIDTLIEEKIAGGFTVQRLDIGGLAVRFVPTKHLLPGYSVSFEGTSKFVFSSDTARTDELVALAAGADLFLCEASGLDSDAGHMEGAHLTARQAGEVGRAAGVRRLLITHFWPEYDPAELGAQAAAGFGGPVTAVREGQTYIYTPIANEG